MCTRLKNISLVIISIFSVSTLVGLSPAAAQDATDDEPVERIQVSGSHVTLNDEYPGGQLARGGRAGILGNLDFMESPFNALNFTDDLIREQQAQSVADVLQNDPVVRVAKGFGNFQEVYVMRGFPVYSDDMTYNGLFGILPRQYVASELLERVEVFRGASSFLNGAAPGGSAIGGSVNVVPKRAGTEPLNRITAGFEGRGHGYLAADVSRRFGDEERSTGIRANLVERDGETAVRGQERALSVASLGVDYDAQSFRFSADIGYQDHQVDAPRPSVTPSAAIPTPPSSDTNFAQPWTYSNERQLFGAVRGEYDLSDSVTLWLAGGLRDGKEDNILANPNADADGSLSAYRFDNVREDQVYSYEAGVRSMFTTGQVSHQLTLSASHLSMDSDNAYAFSDYAGFASDLYSPVEAQMPVADFFVGGDLAAPGLTEQVEMQSVALANTMAALDGQLLVTLGARSQAIELNSFDYNTGDLLSGYDESAVTPLGGVVYRVSEHLSVYANYAEGLLAGDVAPATSGGTPIENAGEVFSPYRAKQYETGVKYDYGRIAASVGVFSTKQPSAFVSENRFSVDGEQTNRGLEAVVFGLPAENLRLVGGFTWLDAKQTRTEQGAFDGNDAIGVPQLQVNLNAEYDMSALPGLTFDARAVYTGSQYADAANSIEVDDFYRVDLGARYAWFIGDNELTVRARVDNLFDANDWVSVGGFPGSNYLVLSEPRNFKVSASLSF